MGEPMTVTETINTKTISIFGAKNFDVASLLNFEILKKIDSNHLNFKYRK